MPYTQGVKSCDGSYVWRRVWIAINASCTRSSASTGPRLKRPSCALKYARNWLLSLSNRALCAAASPSRPAIIRARSSGSVDRTSISSQNLAFWLQPSVSWNPAWSCNQSRPSHEFTSRGRLEHAFGTNRSSATVAEGGGTHDELRFKRVANDGRRVDDLWTTGFSKRRPCQILVFRWQQHNQSLMSDLKPAPALHGSGTGEPAGRVAPTD